MRAVGRKAAFAIPFGAATALLTHAVRFGDDHDMGGDAHAGIVTLAVGGSVAIGLTILHAFFTAGTATLTGSLAGRRLGALVPRAPAIFAVAATTYYGIESLEGNGIEFGLPTLVLAAIAALIALVLRGLATGFARLGTRLAELLDAPAPPRGPRTQRAARTRPVHAPLCIVAPRFGRPPPAAIS